MGSHRTPCPPERQRRRTLCVSPYPHVVVPEVFAVGCPCPSSPADCVLECTASICRRGVLPGLACKRPVVVILCLAAVKAHALPTAVHACWCGRVCVSLRQSHYNQHSWQAGRLVSRQTARLAPLPVFATDMDAESCRGKNTTEPPSCGTSGEGAAGGVSAHCPAGRWTCGQAGTRAGGQASRQAGG